MEKLGSDRLGSLKLSVFIIQGNSMAEVLHTAKQGDRGLSHTDKQRARVSLHSRTEAGLADLSRGSCVGAL